MVTQYEGMLGRLAMRYRRTGDGEERKKIAQEYANVVHKLIQSKAWQESPPPEDQLPYAEMPREYYEYWSSAELQNSSKMDESAHKLKHADLLYDYIKFHLGLYIATPPLLAVVASGLGVADKASFRHGMLCLVAICFIAGVHASWTVASRINTKWESADLWLNFGNSAGSWPRRLVHHYLYWLGLLLGLLGMAGLLP
jgi:hypothetical protein